MTKRFQYGLIKKEVRTVKKEMMVRALPTSFLREGDKAFLQVMVNNASAAMSGTVDVDLIDPETGEVDCMTLV